MMRLCVPIKEEFSFNNDMALNRQKPAKSEDSNLEDELEKAYECK